MTTRKHDVESEAESLIREINEKAETIEDELEAYTKATTNYIKKNPVKSTVIAAVAGIIVGKLLG